MSKSVLVVAGCCADIIFTGLQRIPALGQEEYGDGLYLRPGGGANTAYMLGKLGTPVAMLTVIGNDFFGNCIIDTLSSASVEMSLVKKMPVTSVSAVMVCGNERSFASYSANDFHPTQDEIRSALHERSIVHSYLYYSSVFSLPRLCSKQGILLFLDAGWGFFPKGDELKKILDGVWVFKLNRAEAQAMTQEQTPEEMLNVLSKMCANVIITLGEDGCAAVINSIYYRVKAPGITVVDTTGSGDAFSAGFLSGYVEGLDGQALLERACKAGSYCATLVGGTDPAFSREALLQLAGGME